MTGNVGNAQDAQFISDWHQGERCRFSSSAPEGWKLLGAGCYRTVYASPSGVAYKVQGAQSGQTNVGEHKSLRRLHFFCKMPKGTRLPRHTLYRIDGSHEVMAMEMLGKTLRRYFGNDRQRYETLAREIASATRMWDMHYDNVMIDSSTGELVPVDFGE